MDGWFGEKDGDILSRLFFFFPRDDLLVPRIQPGDKSKCSISSSLNWGLAQTKLWLQRPALSRDAENRIWCLKPTPGLAEQRCASLEEWTPAFAPRNTIYRCPNVNAEQMGGRKAAFHAGMGRADSNKPTIVRQKFLETDAANSVLQSQFWSLGSAGRRLCSLWINVLLLHYSLSFKGLPGNLSLLSIEWHFKNK